MPEGVQRKLQNYVKERDIALSDPYADASVDSIRRWVRKPGSRSLMSPIGGSTSACMTAAQLGDAPPG
jgi:hypothetical protein